MRQRIETSKKYSERDRALGNSMDDSFNAVNQEIGQVKKNNRDMLQVIKYLALFGILLFVSACSDPEIWSDHYKAGSSNVQDGFTIMKQLEKMDQCSNFYQAILSEKLDTMLNSNYLFTVLAPTNEYFDISGIEKENRIRTLSMYILYGEYYTQKIEGRRRMKSDKFLNFVSLDNGNVLVDNRVEILYNQSNNECENGVVHVVDSVIAYRQNTYQYLYENFSSFKKYFDTKIKREVDYEHSKRTGEFDTITKLMIYDTVYIETNTFLENVVDLTNDELQYTTIIPVGSVVDDAIDANVSQYFGGISNIPDYIYESIFDDILGGSVFVGAYRAEDLPDQLLSVKFEYQTIDKTQLDQVNIELSNGLVHTTKDIVIDNSSFLKDISADFRADAIDNQILPYRRSNEDIGFKNAGYLIWQTVLDGAIGEYIEFDFKDFLATDYDVIFNSGSNWGDISVEVSVISDHLANGEGVQVLGVIDYAAFNGGASLGTVSFSSFGDATLRFKIVGPPEGNSGKGNDNYLRLKTIKFSPIPKN